MVARIDDVVNALPRNIFENRFESPAVAVNVRDDCEPLHGLTAAHTDADNSCQNHGQRADFGPRHVFVEK
jgi:hypothetical protein